MSKIHKKLRGEINEIAGVVIDIALSVIKADIDCYVSHSAHYLDMLANAKKTNLLIDCYFTKCGDGILLMMAYITYKKESCLCIFTVFRKEKEILSIGFAI